MGSIRRKDRGAGEGLLCVSADIFATAAVSCTPVLCVPPTIRLIPKVILESVIIGEKKPRSTHFALVRRTCSSLESQMPWDRSVSVSESTASSENSPCASCPLQPFSEHSSYEILRFGSSSTQVPATRLRAAFLHSFSSNQSRKILTRSFRLAPGRKDLVVRR